MNRESVVLVHANFPKERFSAVDNLLTSQMRESNVFVKIPVDKQGFDNLIWRLNDINSNSFTLSTTSISSIRFYLTDEYNRPLKPAYDWTMSIRVDYFDMTSKIDSILSSIESVRAYLRLMLLDNSQSNKKPMILKKRK